MPYNVLIVEDQEMPKQLFEIFVNSSENYVHVASLSDASLAPTVCRTRKVDLVLMDVCTAQNSSGLDAAEQIKKEVPSVKIIIVTSMPEFSWIKRAKEIGVDSHDARREYLPGQYPVYKTRVHHQSRPDGTGIANIKSDDVGR